MLKNCKIFFFIKHQHNCNEGRLPLQNLTCVLFINSHLGRRCCCFEDDRWALLFQESTALCLLPTDTALVATDKSRTPGNQHQQEERQSSSRPASAITASETWSSFQVSESVNCVRRHSCHLLQTQDFWEEPSSAAAWDQSSPFASSSHVQGQASPLLDVCVTARACCGPRAQCKSGRRIPASCSHG